MPAALGEHGVDERDRGLRLVRHRADDAEPERRRRYASAIPGRLRSRSIAAAAAAAIAVPAAAAAPPPVVHVGSGADEVWILRPHGRATSVVVFGHGWSTPEPSDGFAPWIAHLRARGSIVVYPRYRTDTTSVAGALAAFEAGVRAAFRALGPLHVPVVALGKSFGGSAVFYYASSARAWGVPAPAAVLSVFPAGPVGALPPRPLAARTPVEILVGDADTTAGSGGANAFWVWLGGHARKRYVVVRSRPGFVANHDSAQRSDAVARAVFWAPLDRLIARARH